MFGVSLKFNLPIGMLNYTAPPQSCIYLLGKVAIVLS